MGSVYEWDRIKTREFELFTPDCNYTDDSVCTAAVAYVLLDNLPLAADALRQWCRNHLGRGYGRFFLSWIYNDNMGPYNSYGHGAAMRASPAAFLYRNQSLEEAITAANRETEITNDHPEGMKGARATTHAIWPAFQECRPKRIRKSIEHEYGYDLSRTVDDIRPRYVFDETCQNTVPEAITCARESTSFEDAARNAISLGGDSETLAAIAGSIAEALYGVPEDFVEKAKQYLPSDIIEVVERLYRR